MNFDRKSRSQLPVTKTKVVEYMCSKTVVSSIMKLHMFNKILLFTMNTADDDINIWSNENNAFFGSAKTVAVPTETKHPLHGVL